MERLTLEDISRSDETTLPSFEIVFTLSDYLRDQRTIIRSENEESAREQFTCYIKSQPYPQSCGCIEDVIPLKHRAY